MTQPKKILLTFDYEPFLGIKSGTAEKCIIQPTDLLRDILNRNKAKAIFFVDTLYMLNLEKHPELNRDFTRISAQLKALHKEGHYIYPHIHPHWLDAVYSDDKRQFSLTDFSRYSLANPFNREKIQSLFEDSVRCLNNIGVSYSEWGYRAGGWCIQPFHLFKTVFTELNFGFDFSVLPGYKNDDTNQTFDFSMVTNRQPYHFSDIVEKPDKDGKLIEFPISTIQLSQPAKWKDRLVKKYLWKTGDKGFGDGIGAKTAALKFNLNNQEMISIELLNVSKLSSYKKYLQNEGYMHWISHPKMFTKHGLNMFDRFLKFASDNYDLVYDFKEMIPAN